MEIYIGSSFKETSAAKVAAKIVADLEHEPILWCEHSVFKTGKPAFECLEDIANSVQLAIFVLAEDEIAQFADGQAFKESVSGILAEYGLFRGVLGKSNVLVCANDKAEKNSNINGLIRVNFEDMDTAGQKIKEWLEDKHYSDHISHYLLPNGDKCLITVPEHNYDIDNLMESFTRINDTNSLLKLSLLISKSKEVSFGGDSSSIRNKIYVGSPTITGQINQILEERIADFKWYVTQEHFDKFYGKVFKQMPNSGILEISADGWEGYKFFGKSFEYQHGIKDCAFIMKFNLQDVILGDKTVYLLFGIGEMGRQAAINYFINSHKELMNKYKSSGFMISSKIHKYNDKIIEGEWSEIKLRGF